MASTTTTLSAKRQLSLIQFLLVIVGIPLAVMAVMWSYNGVQEHTAPDSILGVTRISAASIDKILCDAKSPACKVGMGTDIVNRSWQYDIDGNFLLAVFHEGSNYGKLPCNPTLACITYDGKSWDSSYNTWLSGVHTQYVKKGITTTSAVIAAIGPPSQAAYLADVNASMNTWRAAYIAGPDYIHLGAR
jgi:hypothetical protein